MLRNDRGVTPGLKSESLRSHYVAFCSIQLKCSLQPALPKPGCKDPRNGCDSWADSGQTAAPETRVRPGQSEGGLVPQAQDGFLNGLHVNEAVATAVAMDWPGISSQFSAEL